jgi:hypothetical protein
MDLPAKGRASKKFYSSIVDPLSFSIIRARSYSTRDQFITDMHHFLGSLLDFYAKESTTHASAKILFDSFTSTFITNVPLDKSWISAVVNNNLPAVKKGLKKGNTSAVYQGISNISHPSDHIGVGTTWTPVHAASFQGNSTVVEMLLQYGADIEAVDGVYSGTPLLWASYAGKFDMV